MPKITESASNGYLGDGSIRLSAAEHPFGVLQSKLFDESHRRLPAAPLEMIKDTAGARGCGFRKCLHRYWFVPMRLDVFLCPTNLPIRCRARLAFN